MAKEVCCDIVGDLHRRNFHHVVLKIFRHLDVHDLGEAKKVSSLWAEALANKKLWVKAMKRDREFGGAYAAKMVPLPVNGSADEYFKLSLKRRDVIDLWLKKDRGLFDHISSWSKEDEDVSGDVHYNAAKSLVIVRSFIYGTTKKPPISCFNKNLDVVFTLGTQENFSSPKCIVEAVSADDGALITVTVDGTITFWDLDTQKPTDEINLPPGKGRILVFKVIGNFLVVSTEGMELFVYQLADKDASKKLICHESVDGTIRDVVANKDNIFLLMRMEAKEKISGGTKDTVGDIEKGVEADQKSSKSESGIELDINDNQLKEHEMITAQSGNKLMTDESKMEENVLTLEETKEDGCHSELDSDDDSEPADNDRVSYHGFSGTSFLVTFSLKSFKETCRVPLNFYECTKLAILDDRYVLMNEEGFIRIYDSGTGSLSECKIEAPQGTQPSEYMYTEIDKVWVLMNELILAEVTVHPDDPDDISVSTKIFVIKKDALLAAMNGDRQYFRFWSDWVKSRFSRWHLAPAKAPFGLLTISSNIINVGEDASSVYLHDDRIFMIMGRGRYSLLHAIDG